MKEKAPVLSSVLSPSLRQFIKLLASERRLDNRFSFRATYSKAIGWSEVWVPPVTVNPTLTVDGIRIVLLSGTS